ncbi:predicted protein [Histoplasma mississippiense (nom. inval.)]|uniref:predicted protein n=1 Tax=Ajellomyces capsulatus (strain NAm1 / WU24) TaxID=2059318 RepID=UPI000157C17C|nr:predicted protein [Histoplasma mississippiense (nom. inval.)]EDN07792.1 predicted protein [Histoplasma mississippiense (nom. inval.)]
MTGSGCQFPKPNPNQKKRRGNTRRLRIEELSKLEALRTELSVLAEELKSKPQVTQSPGASIPSERENSISNLSRQPEDIPETHTRFSNFLPKSPIVTRLEQRAQKLKQRANEQDIDRLKYNPWAQLLASPVRMCAATGARVPEKLLGSWGLVQHPETQNLWLMPVDLVKEELQRVSLKNVSEVDPGLPSPPPRSSFPNFYMTNDEELLGAFAAENVLCFSKGHARIFFSTVEGAGLGMAQEGEEVTALGGNLWGLDGFRHEDGYYWRRGAGGKFAEIGGFGACSLGSGVNIEKDR